MEEMIIPIMDILIKSAVNLGRLYERSEILNLSPPSIKGSQPKKKIKKEAVAQDQNPSKTLNEYDIFLEKEI